MLRATSSPESSSPPPVTVNGNSSCSFPPMGRQSMYGHQADESRYLTIFPDKERFDSISNGQLVDYAITGISRAFE